MIFSFCLKELLSDPECYPDLLLRAQELINLLKLSKYVVLFLHRDVVASSLALLFVIKSWKPVYKI